MRPETLTDALNQHPYTCDLEMNDPQSKTCSDEPRYEKEGDFWITDAQVLPRLKYFYITILYVASLWVFKKNRINNNNTTDPKLILMINKYALKRLVGDILLDFFQIKLLQPPKDCYTEYHNDLLIYTSLFLVVFLTDFR